MGMFGKSRAQAQEPYVPNPDPIYGELNPALTAPMPKKRGLFGGGVGKALGTVADVLMYGPFVGQARENRAWRRERQQAEIEKEHASAEKFRREATQPQFQNVAGVGLVRINPDGTTETAVGAQPEETSLLREMRAAGIDPASEEGRLMIARAARGYQFTPEMQQQMIATQAAIAQARAAATAAHRAPPAAPAPKLPAGFILDQ